MATDNFQPLINSINEGKVATIAVEFMEKHLQQLHDAVDTRIYLKMSSGKKIEYEEMAMAFAEKNAYKNLIKAMKQTTRKGVSAGTQFAELTKEKDNGRKARRVVSAYRGV